MDKAELHWGQNVLTCICTLVCLLHSPVATNKTCSVLEQFPFLMKNRRLVNYDIVSINTNGLVICARHCLSTRLCKSFNFDEVSGACDLNYATLTPGGLNTTHLVTSSYVFSDAVYWPETILGTCSHHTCPLNTVCQPINSTIYMCQLLLPTKCAEVKQCDSTRADGEYLVRTKSYGYQVTRIYCHDMANNPQDFLTLETLNYGCYPPVMNQGCLGETDLGLGCVGRGGEAWYNKININTETMRVNRQDTTFANMSNYNIPYGEAMDCYTRHDNGLASCGTVGSFTINLTGTGWAVKPGTTWAAFGWRAVIEEEAWSDDGMVVQLRCGGFPGSCYPPEGLFLTPSPQGFPTGSATEVICPL